MEEIQEIVEKMKELQQKVLDYIDDDGECEEDPYEDLILYLNEIEIDQIQNGFIQFLQFLVKLSNNHHRTPDFLSKIEKILLNFKDQIKQSLSNLRLFKIFGSNKPLFLFLIKEGIVTPDKYIYNRMNNDYFKLAKYFQFFYPEFKKFYDQKTIEDIEKELKDCIQPIEDFNEKREIGESDKTICTMIREDSIDDFITYMNEKNISINITIDPTIFESNSSLITKTPSLAEYSAFFGSLQIFKYLDLNKASLTPSLWLYSIHGKNGELIHHLEELKILPKDWSFFDCLLEAIKCHHNDIANYIQNNLMDLRLDEIKQNDMTKYAFKCLNYFYFPESPNYESIFYDLCENNYLEIVALLLKTTNIDINLQRKIFFSTFSIQFYRKSFNIISHFDFQIEF